MISKTSAKSEKTMKKLSMKKQVDPVLKTSGGHFNYQYPQK